MATATTMPQAYKEQIYKLTNEQKLNLVEFILQTMHSPSVVEDKESKVYHAHQLDDALYGSIQLPADFDYKKELEFALTEKYGL